MKLIINSDDLGLSKSITDGIIEGLVGGYITSATLMSNMEYAQYAIDECLKNKINHIGVHVNFSIGKPLIKNPSIQDDDGNFLKIDEQIKNIDLTYNDAYNEIIAQIDFVEKRSNGKIKVDHLDFHKPRLMENTNIQKAFIDIAKERNLPVRNLNVTEVNTPDIFFDKFSLEDKRKETIIEMIKIYKNKDVTIELLTHSGFIDEYTKNITSLIDRDLELNILKDCYENNVYKEVELINFNDIKR